MRRPIHAEAPGDAESGQQAGIRRIICAPQEVVTAVVEVAVLAAKPAAATGFLLLSPLRLPLQPRLVLLRFLQQLILLWEVD